MSKKIKTYSTNNKYEKYTMKYLDMVKLPSLNSAATTTKLMNKSTGRRLELTTFGSAAA